MKIVALTRHYGLGWYFDQVLARMGEHRVLYPHAEDRGPIPDADVYVVGAPAEDLMRVSDRGKPVIYYCALWDWRLEAGEEAVRAAMRVLGNRFVVGASDPAWMAGWDEHFHLPYTVAQYAFDPAIMPRWTGGINRVLIRCHNAQGRLASYTARTIDNLMAGLPYHVHEYVPAKKAILDAYAQNDVMLYWNCAPYTLVYAEAMTVGIPVVALHNWEFPTEQWAVVRCDPFPECVKRICGRLLEDKAERERVSVAQRAVVREHFDWADALAQWGELFDRAVNG